LLASTFFSTSTEGEPAKVPLARELRALGITPKVALAPQLQRGTEPEVPQTQTELDVPQTQTKVTVSQTQTKPIAPERQAESETETERDTPSESEQSSRMPESIKITELDKFDGKNTSIAAVTA